MKKISQIIISALIIALTFTAGIAYAANPASFSVVASSPTVNVGDLFTVSIFEDGDNVTAVTSRIAYDDTKLQQQSIACGSAFPNAINETNGITCYTTSGAPVGNVVVAVVTFKALVGSGSSTVSIASGSIIASNGTNIWNRVSAATNVAFATPVPAPTPVVVPAPAPVSTVQPTVNANAVTIAEQPAVDTGNHGAEDTLDTDITSVLGTESDKKTANDNETESKNTKKTDGYELISLVLATVVATLVATIVAVRAFGLQINKPIVESKKRQAKSKKTVAKKRKYKK